MADDVLLDCVMPHKEIVYHIIDASLLLYTILYIVAPRHIKHHEMLMKHHMSHVHQATHNNAEGSEDCSNIYMRISSHTTQAYSTYTIAIILRLMMIICMMTSTGADIVAITIKLNLIQMH